MFKCMTNLALQLWPQAGTAESIRDLLYDSHAWFSRDAIQLGGFFRVHLPLAYKAEERLAEATETIRYVGRGTWKRCSQWRKHLCYLDPAPSPKGLPQLSGLDNRVR